MSPHVIFFQLTPAQRHKLGGNRFCLAAALKFRGLTGPWSPCPTGAWCHCVGKALGRILAASQMQSSRVAWEEDFWEEGWKESCFWGVFHALCQSNARPQHVSSLAGHWELYSEHEVSWTSCPSLAEDMNVAKSQGQPISFLSINVPRAQSFFFFPLNLLAHSSHCEFLPPFRMATDV